MGLVGCRGEDLKQLHQNGGQESDDHLSLHGMQTLGERDRERQRKNKQMNVSKEESETEPLREKANIGKGSETRRYKIIAAGSQSAPRRDALQPCDVKKKHNRRMKIHQREL